MINEDKFEKAFKKELNTYEMAEWLAAMSPYEVLRVGLNLFEENGNEERLLFTGYILQRYFGRSALALLIGMVIREDKYYEYFVSALTTILEEHYTER